MHAALERLYERAARWGSPASPRFAERLGRARAGAGRRALPPSASCGASPPERAIGAGSSACCTRFLPEESGARPGGFEPWLLEARFGESEDSNRPALEIDGWRLHGAIDRVDRDREGRALVLDYKLSEQGHPARKSLRRRRSCSCSST